MTTATTAPTQSMGEATGDLREAFSELLQTGITTIASKVSKVVDGSVDSLHDAGAPVDVQPGDGPAMNAGADAVDAKVSGKSPVWGALKGAWSGASGKAKTVLWLVALLGVLLSPVVLVVLLLGLIVLAIVTAVRAAKR